MAGCGETLYGAKIDRGFWSAFRETAVREGIPYQWRALNDEIEGAEPSHCMHNFRVAAGREQGGFEGCVFQDSDAAKWLEAVAYSLRWHPDPALEAVADGAIQDVVDAQRPDGYMDTYYIVNGLDGRWTNLKDNHELYVAGHMIEAAVAYFQATGKRALLDAVLRLVDHIDGVIGPEDGKLHGYPGHPVIEMALMRLYGVTGDEKHLRLAEYFVRQRGAAPLYFEEEDRKNGNAFYWKDSPFLYQYYQAGIPFMEQADAEGHAVRAMYLYSGAADVARARGDAALADVCRRLWQSTVRRRMYVTGAVGSSEYGESFTFDYDLPNDTVYGETCAAVGLVFFARRMLALEKKGEYADVMERALYNGALSGMQLDGKRFFYVNPLEVQPIACEKDAHKRHVKPERQRWFGCACCPPNIIRLLASLEDYLYTRDGDDIYVHLYAGGSVEFALGEGRVTLVTQTNYPWEGDAAFTVRTDRPAPFALHLRVPGWCARWQLSVNGEAVEADAVDGYACVRRVWEDGDQLALSMDMPVRLVRANPRVREDAGKVAVCRGPLVYCLEEADNGKDLHLARLGDAKGEDFEIEWLPDKLGGIVEVRTDGLRETDAGWGDALYSAALPVRTEPAKLTFVPYYSWANRGVGEMCVWMRR